MKNLRPEVKECLQLLQPGMHGMDDMLDDLFVSFYNITLDEYDYICEQANDNEIKILTEALGSLKGVSAPFSVRRNALELRNFYVRKFHNL